MYPKDCVTQLKLSSPLPRSALAWLAITALIAGLYIWRASIEFIPPEDHVALSIILCCLLTQLWMQVEQTRVTISLPHNRCWLRHHRMGRYTEKSLPVSQIHSARIEHADTPIYGDIYPARIVLVTSLGMIPASTYYPDKPRLLYNTCTRINTFLGSNESYFHA